MKNALYVIATLILVIWGLIYFGFHSGEGVHILLVAAGFIVLVRIIFSKQLGRS
jgi:tryptophan-rich sensory protein